MHFWFPRPWTSSPPASSPLSGSSQLREAPGNHMLSQLGLPASNRDTLTLIHSTGEVLSLARRRESTNTETFTLHQIDSAAYNPLPPPPASHLSLSLLLPLLFATRVVCLLLWKSSFPWSIVRVAVIFIFTAVYLTACLPPPPSLPHPPSILVFVHLHL